MVRGLLRIQDMISPGFPEPHHFINLSIILDLSTTKMFFGLWLAELEVSYFTPLLDVLVLANEICSA